MSLSFFAPEHHDKPLGWNPLSFLHDAPEPGPVVLAAALFMVVAAVAFFCTFWRHRQFFLSLPLFCALAPLIFAAIIMYVRLYRLLVFAPTEGADFLNEARCGGYAFQFSLCLSGALLLIHTVAHAVFRNDRNA